MLSHAISAVYLLVFAGFHVILNTQLYFVRQFAVQTNLIFVAVVYVISSLLHVRRPRFALFMESASTSIRVRAKA